MKNIQTKRKYSQSIGKSTIRIVWGCVLVCVSGLITLAMADVDTDTAAMVARMKAGGHILMIRHALAPGTGDPADFQIGDCSTQRNLDDRGREQARTIGEWLRAHDITSTRVYSSQWCRCLETAELLEMGVVEELPALNSFFQRPQDREPNLKALREFIAEQPPDGELIILVTHFVTISAIADEGVSSGEGVLLKLNDEAPYEVVGRVETMGADRTD
jgi:phosphohistidine phosphatase SixA